MSTRTAPVGQSFSQGMQYQHSSNFMKALFFVRSMASTSSGHTSTQTVQPLSAMHLSSSMTTGAWVRVRAMVMALSFGASCGSGSRRRGHTQALVGGLLFVVELHHVGFDLP